MSTPTLNDCLGNVKGCVNDRLYLLTHPYGACVGINCYIRVSDCDGIVEAFVVEYEALDSSGPNVVDIQAPPGLWTGTLWSPPNYTSTASGGGAYVSMVNRLDNARSLMATLTKSSSMNVGRTNMVWRAANTDNNACNAFKQLNMFPITTSGGVYNNDIKTTIGGWDFCSSNLANQGMLQQIIVLLKATPNQTARPL